VPDNDLSRDTCKDHGIKPARNIEDALLVGGKLAVESVLLIAEHGNYRSTTGQILYPATNGWKRCPRLQEGGSRARLLRQALSYTFSRARSMLARARSSASHHGGSSLP